MWFAASLLMILAAVRRRLPGAPVAVDARGARSPPRGGLRGRASRCWSFGTDRWPGGPTPRQDLGYDAGPRRWVEVFALDGRPLYLRGDCPNRAAIVQSALRRARIGARAYRRFARRAGAPSASADRRAARSADGRCCVRVARAEDALVAELRRLLAGRSCVSIPVGVSRPPAAGYIVSGRMLRPLSRMAAHGAIDQRRPAVRAAAG
ncbi:MAG: hypothetical protein MZW92_40280 [Comamonadaceae bacterium]|nr:hypothetical protein [Comamonadaceae bacterium]